MVADLRKSRKHSSGSGAKPHKSFTLYLDENYNSEEVRNILAKAGIRFYSGVFPAGTPDEEFLPKIGRRKWILITTDRNIRFRGVEKLSVVQYKVRLFVFTGNMGNRAMAETLVKAKNKLREFCRTHQPGFIAVVHKNGKVELRMDAEGNMHGGPETLRKSAGA